MKQFDKLYINGEWAESNNTGVIEVINPATENPCACVPRGNREDVNAAVASARQAFNSWAHTPAEKRAEIMNAVADEMQRRADGKTRLPRAWW
jgi:acyl-CoA reductase-like NAD-dependent aldehyde dehydrogenase